MQEGDQMASNVVDYIEYPYALDGHHGCRHIKKPKGRNKELQSRQ